MKLQEMLLKAMSGEITWLQAADILLYKADAVPIGEDQLPHVELTHEIGRRFNHIFKTDFFPDCKAILTPTPRLLGLDGRKMSKSYQNTINLSDTPAEITNKVRQMFTDPKRIKMKDPGHPEECNVYNYYQIFAPQMKNEVYQWCTGAQKGCTGCKDILAQRILERLKPIQEKRRELERHPDAVWDALAEGKKKAAAIAKKTIAEVRAIIF